VLNKRTAIGIGVGGAIIALGLFSLVTSFGVQTIQVDDTYGLGDSTTYSLTAPESSTQYVNITGTSFTIDLKTPRGGLQISEREHKNNVDLQWVHLIDGDSVLKIKNTGDSDLHVTGTFEALVDPIQITYHILVIIAGMIIVGFSSAFSVRKPRGF
jgi:hypothetical protein